MVTLLNCSKQFWPDIGNEVVQAILQFFETGKLLKGNNYTTVTLILKVQNPTYVKEFRLIASRSTLYKIIAKILIVRLKLVFGLLVGPSRSSFIKGRNIIDNIIMAHNLIKGYTQKAVSLRCMVKIDIKKAYDSVEQSFLSMPLLEFGIPFKMVTLIMECVTTVSYTLLVNGVLTNRFEEKKALR